MNYSKFDKIFLVCTYISIFISSIVLIKRPAEFYLGYVLFVLTLPVFLIKLGIPRWSVIFLLLFLFGIYQISEGNNTPELFFKVFLGMFLSYLFYYYIIVNFNYRVQDLFKFYLLGAYIVSIIGLVQFISFQVGFTPGYNFNWILNKWGFVAGGNFGIRINSVFPEPTYFATFVSPALFIAVYDLLITRVKFYYSRLQCIMIIGVYLLSFSGLGYIGVFLTLAVFLFNYGLIRYFLLAIPVLLIAINFFYNNVDEFRQRTDSTIEIFSTGKFDMGTTHGSALTLYNNYYIAVENFKRNFLFGTGLGSHPLAADKYSLTKDINIFGFQFNYADANSMFLRLLSETGLFGIVIFHWILFKCFIRKPAGNDSNFHWLISNSIFILILLNLFRQGHYFLNGFPFYIWLYIFNYFEHRKVLSDNPASTVNLT